MQVATVLSYAHENQVDAFLEPTVEMCLALLKRDMLEATHAADHLHVPEHSGYCGHYAALAGNALSHISFCRQGSTALAFLAADCILLISQVRALHQLQIQLSLSCVHIVMVSKQSSADS